MLENGQRIAERFVAWYRERREAAARKQRICSQNGHVIVVGDIEITARSTMCEYYDAIHDYAFCAVSYFAVHHFSIS